MCKDSVKYGECKNIASFLSKNNSLSISLIFCEFLNGCPLGRKFVKIGEAEMAENHASFCL